MCADREAPDVGKHSQSSQPQADEQSFVGFISKEGVHQRTILLTGPARGLELRQVLYTAIQVLLWQESTYLQLIDYRF